MKVKEQKAITLRIKEKDISQNVDRSFRTLKEEIDRIVTKRNDDGFETTVPSPYQSVIIEKSIKELDMSTQGGTICLHRNCVGCKNGTCSGVHMISCPCKSCSPWC